MSLLYTNHYVVAECIRSYRRPLAKADEHESAQVKLINSNIHLASVKQDGGYPSIPCHVLCHDRQTY